MARTKLCLPATRPPHVWRVNVTGLLVLILTCICLGCAKRPAKSLHEAAADGDIRQVQLQLARRGGLAQGGAVNAKNQDGQTPLHWAAARGHKDVAELLVRSGADVNAKDNYGNSPLHFAARAGCTDVAELLLGEGADINAEDKTGKTALHSAACYGHKDMAELLLSKGADVRAKDNYGRTPLHWAAMQGRADVAESLIAKGADVQEQDKLGKKPLSLAVRQGITMSLSCCAGMELRTIVQKAKKLRTSDSEVVTRRPRPVTRATSNERRATAALQGLGQGPIL